MSIHTDWKNVVEYIDEEDLKLVLLRLGFLPDITAKDETYALKNYENFTEFISRFLDIGTIVDKFILACNVYAGCAYTKKLIAIYGEPKKTIKTRKEYIEELPEHLLNDNLDNMMIMVDMAAKCKHVYSFAKYLLQNEYHLMESTNPSHLKLVKAFKSCIGSVYADEYSKAPVGNPSVKRTKVEETSHVTHAEINNTLNNLLSSLDVTVLRNILICIKCDVSAEALAYYAQTAELLTCYIVVGWLRLASVMESKCIPCHEIGKESIIGMEELHQVFWIHIL